MKYDGQLAFMLQDASKLVPHGDRLIVEVIELESAVFTGTGIKIVIPETTDIQVERGWQLARVVAIGSGHRLETDTIVPIRDWFSPGDLVFIERLTGRKLRLQHKDYLIISQIDVLAIAPKGVALPEPVDERVEAFA